MDPRNEDLIKNLSIAEAKIKDRIILPDEFYFVKVYGNFKSRYTLKEWLLSEELLCCLQLSHF